MLSLLRSGETVSIEYYSYSESRKTGGDKKLITCKYASAKKGEYVPNALPKQKRESPHQQDIIICDMQLIAGSQPIEDEFRKVYPLFITKINGLEVVLS